MSEAIDNAMDILVSKRTGFISTNAAAKTIRAELKHLRAERDWLADALAEGYGWGYGTKDEPSSDSAVWRGRAREATR